MTTRSPGAHRAVRPPAGGRRSVSALLAGATALGATALIPGAAAADPLPTQCSQAGSTVTCTYGPGAASFTAPTGITSFSVVADGAAGGQGGTIYGPSGAGGRGTELSGVVPVGASRTFDLLVGARGGAVPEGSLDGGTGRGSGGRGGFVPGSSTAGGGGGGGTSLGQGGTTLLVAGGGGGGGAVLPGDPLAGSQAGRPAGTTVTPSSPDGGDGQTTATLGDPAPTVDRSGGGGGGGLVGGSGGAPGQGGSAGTSTTAGFTATAGSTGDGSLVISYQVPAPTPAGPGAKADLATTIDAPTSLAVGQSGTVTVTVTNHGTVTADRVRTVVALPSTLRATGSGTTTRFDEAALAPGQTATYTVDVVARRAGAKQQIHASSTSRTPDASLRDNVARHFVTVGVTPPPP